MHSHSDWRLWGNRRAESKIRQGVTTEVVGNCGFSPAPVATEFVEDLRAFALYIPTGMDFAWRSVGEYLQAFDRDGTALNVVQLVGHGTLRIAAMGFARRPPTGAELTQHAADHGRRHERGRVGPLDRAHLRPGVVGDDRGDHRRGQGGRALSRLLRQPHPRGGRHAARRGTRGHPRRPRGIAARAGESHQGGRPAQLGQGRRRAGADRRGPRRGARRHGRRLSVHRLQHVAPHRAARLGAGGRRGGDAQAPGRSRRARARSAPSWRIPRTPRA